MANTKNYNLTVPDLDGAANIELIGDNMEIIDEVLKENSDKATNAQNVAENAVADIEVEKNNRKNAIETEAAAREEADNELREEISGKAPSAHSHGAGNITSGTFSATGVKARTGTDYSTSRVRNIYAGTADMTAGTSLLSNGDIYLVYE